MRALAAVLLITFAAACSEEDPYPYRPPGGHGGGGNMPGPDGGPDVPDAGPDAGTLLTGRVCVVDDVANPFACPANALAEGVTVAVDGTSTTSGTGGTFSIDPAPASGTLQVSGSGLVTTLSLFDLADAPIDAPALAQATWDEVLASLVLTQSTGAMLLYIQDDAGAPVANATISGPDAALVYYDDGVGGFDANATTTGASGMALVVNIDAATAVTATEGARTSPAVTVPTVDLGVGVAFLTLPP